LLHRDLEWISWQILSILRDLVLPEPSLGHSPEEFSFGTVEDRNRGTLRGMELRKFDIAGVPRPLMLAGMTRERIGGLQQVPCLVFYPPPNNPSLPVLLLTNRLLPVSSHGVDCVPAVGAGTGHACQR